MKSDPLTEEKLVARDVADFAAIRELRECPAFDGYYLRRLKERQDALVERLAFGQRLEEGEAEALRTRIHELDLALGMVELEYSILLDRASQAN